jgi:M3 family oligoendopeptidase
MKKSVTKWIAVLCAALLTLGTFGCAGGSDSVVSSAYAGVDSGNDSAQPTATAEPSYGTFQSNLLPSTAHADVTFAQMAYERPDIEGMQAQMNTLKDDVQSGKPVQMLITAYRALQTQYAHADSMLSLAYLLYATDVTQSYYRDEYAYLQSTLGELDADMEGVSYALFDSSSEAQAMAKESFGEDYVDSILQSETFSDTSVQDLSDQEEQLVLQYDNLSSTFTLLDNGKQWSLNEIENDLSLSNDEYYRLYDAYCAELNRQAGAIFLQLVQIRSQIAAKLNYANYSDYCYESYGRDYTPDDARKLHEAVKQYISPVYIYVNDRNNAYDLADATFAEQDFLDQLSVAAKDFSPLLDEPVQYLLRNNLYDFSYGKNKMDSNFTTYLSDYNAPFIFSTWTGESTDIATILHELGHFTSYYHNAVVGYSATDNLDLAEVDSQALVLLMMKYFDSFYGQYAQQAKTEVLLDAMYSLVSGCMEDEFQQDIYENPDMTLDEMNSLYQKLAKEYGLDDVYGYQGTEWVLITHTFQSPLYYISYAVSIVPALELFELSQTDETAAKNTYFNILMRDPFSKFIVTIDRNDLSSVFSNVTIKQIAAIVDQNT